jgi:RHS repeat-associated protein
LISVSDAFSSYAFTYDEAGNVLTVDNDDTPGVPQVVLTSGYDGANRRTSLEDDLGLELVYQRDGGGLIDEIALTQGMTEALIGLTIDQVGRITEISRSVDMGDPVTTLLEYDARNAVTSITHSYGMTELSQFLYTYNTEGELTDYAGPGGDVAYSHDDTHQLTGATGDRTESYTFDLNGNRVTSHLHDDDYETGTNNRLLSDGVFDYEYDDEGNLIVKTEIATGTVTTYAWDYRNRLVSVIVTNSSEDVILEAYFTYDVFNNLIIREIDADGEGAGEAEVLATVYDGIHPWADFDEEGDLLVHYVYAEAVDQIMARIDAAGNVELYLTDNIGSVRQIVESDGTILDEIDYDSFLNILAETNPSNGDRFKGAAREWEAAVDRYFNRARWYDPADGRFLSEDPIRFESRDLNLSRYVGNQPTIHTDPLGLKTCEIRIYAGHFAPGTVIDEIDQILKNLKKRPPGSWPIHIGAVGCSRDQCKQKIEKDFPGHVLPGMPADPGVLSFEDAPAALQAAYDAAVKAAQSLCADPHCDCDYVQIKVTCTKDMRTALQLHGPHLLKLCDQIPLQGGPFPTEFKCPPRPVLGGSQTPHF